MNIDKYIDLLNELIPSMIIPLVGGFMLVTVLSFMGYGIFKTFSFLNIKK